MIKLRKSSRLLGILLATATFVAMAACGGSSNSNYTIPADSKARPFEAPEPEDLVEEDEEDADEDEDEVMEADESADDETDATDVKTQPDAAGAKKAAVPKKK